MSTFSFVEEHPHETGFAEVYDTKIAPFFRDLDAKREETRERHRRQTLVVGGTTFMAALIVASQVHPLACLYVLFFGGAFTAVTYFRRSVANLPALQNFLRPLLCKFMGDMTYHKTPPTPGVPVQRLQQLGVVPRAQKEYIGFGIEGTWRNEHYRLVTARFYERNTNDNPGQSKNRTLFKGIILEVDCPVNMPLTVFARDFGKTFNGFYKWAGRKHMPDHKLDLEDEKLEGIFEVYTDNPETAQERIDARFADTLVQIAERFQTNKSYLSAAFEGRKFYIALTRPQGFMGLDFGDKPFAESNDLLRNAMLDLMIPRDIIDMLHGAGSA